MYGAKEDTEKPVNRLKQLNRVMRMRLNMRNIFMIFMLSIAGLVSAQVDSLQVETDSVKIDSLVMPQVTSQNIADAGYTNPQTYNLADMEISGETRFTKTQILRFTGLRV